MALSFSGRTVVITGAGGALGRAYALEFARRGAQILVNDVGATSVTGGGDVSETAAANVVREIVAGGGKAVANYNSVSTQGHEIIAGALKAFGRVDVVINNAGILRDKSFHKLEKKDWDSVLDVHLTGTFSLCQAAWPHFQQANYGRIINIGSGAGLYGAFGQSNYSAAKMAIVGLSATLAKEGAKHNINVNCIVPIAGSRMTATLLPPAMLALLEPEHSAPIVSYLCHDSCTQSGEIYEIGGGWYSRVRFQRSAGVSLGKPGRFATAEDIRQHMDRISDFENYAASYPSTAADALRDMMSAAAGADESIPTPPPPPPPPPPPLKPASSSVESDNPSVPLQSDAMFLGLQNYAASSPAAAAELQASSKYLVEFVLEDPRGQKLKRWVLDGRSSVPTVTQHALSAQLPAKPACSISLSDETFIKLTRGDLSTEFAFMRGLLKVSGSMGVALKMKAVLSIAGDLSRSSKKN